MALIKDLLSLKSAAGDNGYNNVYGLDAGSDTIATITTPLYLDTKLKNWCPGCDPTEAISFLKTGDKILITTDDAAVAYSTTVRNDGTNVYLDFDNTLFFETQMSDISAATTSWITQPPAGIITEVYAIKWSAITGASAVITFSLDSDAITTGAVTVTVAGDPGTKYSATPTALNIADGSTSVKAVSNAGSTDTAIATVGFKIICPANI